MDDELTELLAKLSVKLLASYRRRLIVMFCVIHIRGQKGSDRMIYICFCLLYIQGRKGSARMIYVVLFGIHSRSKGEC